MENIALQYLGSGYDVFGEYADGVSIKKIIFDLTKVSEKDIRGIPNTNADYFSVKGDSYEEMPEQSHSKSKPRNVLRFVLWICEDLLQY